MDNLLVLFAFLSLFHLLGGGGLGVALRGLRNRPAGTRGCGVNVGLFIWALMFGGLPLMMGLENPGFLPLQLLVLAAAFCATFFFWDRIREMFSNTGVVLTLFGGIFFTAGCGMAGFLLKEREWLMAAIFGLVFGGVGLAAIVLGLRHTLGPPADGEE